MGIPIVKANTCATCAYKVGAADQMYCRFLPPTVTVLMGMSAKGPAPMGQMANFPKVESHWWCGQHRAGLTRTDVADAIPQTMTAQ